MGFWNNVDIEIKYRGISRKELACSIQMKEQTLHKEIERDSEVSAIIALKVSRFLAISIESLLGLEEINIEKQRISPEVKKLADEYLTLSSYDKEILKYLIKKMKLSNL